MILSGLCLLYSCNHGDPLEYAERYSVIRSGTGGTYFTTDNGLELYPGSFDPTKGDVGNRVYIGFSYNPTEVSTTTTKLNITLQSLSHVPTSYNGALPSSSADTVGTGQLYYDSISSLTTFAWLAQNFMTIQFFVKYNDGSKHSFGFIEEPELYRNDTLFLKIWHNSKDTDENSIASSHIALDFKYLKYSDYLASRDSTIISVKYDVVYPSGDIAEKTGYLTYRKKDHLQ
jgi:hypothetical protein